MNLHRCSVDHFWRWGWDEDRLAGTDRVGHGEGMAQGTSRMIEGCKTVVGVCVVGVGHVSWHGMELVCIVHLKDAR